MKSLMLVTVVLLVVVVTFFSGPVVSGLGGFAAHRERGRHRTIETPRGTIHRERGRYRSRSFTPRESSCDADTSGCSGR